MKPNAIQSLADLFSVSHIVAAAAVLVFVWLLLRLVYGLLQLLSYRSARSRLQVGRVFPVIRLVVWAVAIYIIAVVIFRPQQSAVLALSASVGLALGLAAQDLVKNVLAGVFILFDQPFRVGDMVKVGEHYGEVQSVGMRVTRIHTFDDSVVSVPNALIFNQPVLNSNAGNLDEMVVMEFCLPASVDVQAVKNMAWEAAASSPYAYLRKRIDVLVDDTFNRTFLTRFRVKCYVLDVRFERLLASDVIERIKGQVIAHGLLSEAIVLGLLADTTGSAVAPVTGRTVQEDTTSCMEQDRNKINSTDGKL